MLTLSDKLSELHLDTIKDEDTSFPYVVTPIWLSFDPVTKEYVSSLLETASWPTSGPKLVRYELVVASFLKAAQDVCFDAVNRQQNKKGPYLGARFKDEAWSLYPLAGKEVYKKVVLYLLKHFEATKVPHSGDSNLAKDEQGKWSTDPKMSMYELDHTKFPDWILEAKFIDVGRPSIKINRAESNGQKKRRQKLNKAKPHYKITEAKATFGDNYTASESRIQSLNAFWSSHPLVMQDGHAAASATRVYHDGRMDAGGRLYGAWTGLKKDNQGIKKRLYSTIDGEPVCELDIRASQPTLFSSLLGYRLGGLGKDDTWGDVYAEMSSLWSVSTHWSEQDPLIDKIDIIRRNRKVAKGVVMALIGSGLSLKARAPEDLVKEHGLTETGWKLFREQLIHTIPALEELEPRYDNKGQLAGYINGSGFLSYHESEMMMLTLERLMSIGIPAYPVHDCLLVKASDSKTAAQVFREIICDYCFKMNGLKVMVPLSLETLNEVNQDYLPSSEDLLGKYLN